MKGGGVIIVTPAFQRFEIKDLRGCGGGGHQTHRQTEVAPEPPHVKGQSPVATSCQFGSSAPILRAKVQTSR